MTRTQSNLLLVFAAAIWGSTFVVQQVATGNLSAIMFTAARFFLGGMAILPLAFIEYKRKQRSQHKITRSDWLGMIATGVVLFIAAALQQEGIFHTSVANAGFLTALYVPMVPLFAWVFLRTSFHWSLWPASLGCLIGTYIMNGAHSLHLSSGDLWVISSAFFWAMHVILIGKMATKTQAPLLVATVQSLSCATVGLLTAVITESPQVSDFTGAGLGIVYAGLLSVALAFTLQVVAQRNSPAPDTAIILSSETLFAALAAYIFLGDQFTSHQVIGSGLILGGILLVQLLPLYNAKVSIEEATGHSRDNITKNSHKNSALYKQQHHS